jgi:hypothetical protein
MKIVEVSRRNPIRPASGRGALKNMKIEKLHLTSQSDTHCASSIPPETEAALQALLSSIEGYKVKLRSVTLIEDPDPNSAWATEGRVAVQMSHNQRINH